MIIKHQSVDCKKEERMPQKSQEWLPPSLDKRNELSSDENETSGSDECLSFDYSSQRDYKSTRNHRGSSSNEYSSQRREKGNTKSSSNEYSSQRRETGKRRSQPKSNRGALSESSLRDEGARISLDERDSSQKVGDVLNENYLHNPSNDRSIGKDLKGTKIKNHSRTTRTSSHKTDVSSESTDIERHINTWNRKPRETQQRILIDVNNGNENGSNCGSCLMNRKFVIIIIIYAIVATGLWSLFLNWDWSFPGRQEQIDALEEQVDLLDQGTKDLEEQVDRLEIQVTALSNETDRLELLNKEIKGTAHELNETVSRYKEINKNTTDSLAIYEELTEQMSGSLLEAEAINNILSDSISALDIEIMALKSMQSNYTETIEALENQNTQFSSLIDALHLSNEDSEQQIQLLREKLIELEEQNDDLHESHENLVNILTFLRETGIDLNTTIEDLTGYLGDEINENTVLVLLSLEHSYQNVYTYWTTLGLFDDLFEKKPWYIDKDLPIGENDYEKLMSYIDEHVATEVCADREDFENFLVHDPIVGYEGDAPPVNISFRSIRSAIERYFSSLMKHYFSSTDGSVTKLQWMEAMFDCKNLPEDQRYVWN